MNEQVVESALFSAGRPLAIEEIKDATGLTVEQIKKALESLMKDYKERETAIEIAKAGNKYAMQVKAEYAQHAVKLAEMEVPKKLLKTLALIAYHQPLKQSELLRMIGPKVYEHVKELHELGLIMARRDERTKILYTTSRFPEYFGIDATNKKDIKKWLERKAGVRIEDVKKSDTYK